MPTFFCFTGNSFFVAGRTKKNRTMAAGRQERETPTDEPDELPASVCTHNFRRCRACWICNRCPAPDHFLTCRGTEKPHGRADGSRVRIAQTEQDKATAAAAALPFQERMINLDRQARPSSGDMAELKELAELLNAPPLVMADVSSSLRLDSMPQRPFILEDIEASERTRNSAFRFLSGSLNTIAEVCCPGNGSGVLSLFYERQCPLRHGREGDLANALLHNMVAGCQSVPDRTMQKVLAGALLHFSGMSNRDYSALLERTDPQAYEHRFGSNSDWRFLREGRSAFDLVQDGRNPFGSRHYACRVSQDVVDGVVRFVIKMFDVKVGVKRGLQVADSEYFSVQQHVLTMTAKDAFRIYVAEKNSEYMRSHGITSLEAEVCRALARHRAGGALFSTILHMTTTRRISRACLSYFYTNMRDAFALPWKSMEVCPILTPMTSMCRAAKSASPLITRVLVLTVKVRLTRRVKMRWLTRC